MTEEQRLDRLERIVKLMIKAGLRARKTAREHDEKINILIEMHMKNEEMFAKNFADYEARLARNEELASKTDERLAAMSAKSEERLEALAAKTEEKFAAMVAAQASTQEQLQSLAATVERVLIERRNGRP
jgi:gamma-glutamylcysteine synthetase